MRMRKAKLTVVHCDNIQVSGASGGDNGGTKCRVEGGVRVGLTVGLTVRLKLI